MGMAEGWRIRTAFWASPARRRKAFVTVTALSSSFASFSARSSTVLSVISISSGVSTCFATGRVLSGRLVTSGIAGSMRVIVALR